MVSVAELRRRTGGPRDCDRLRAELQESLRSLLEQPRESAENRATCDRVLRACIQRLCEGTSDPRHPDSLSRLGELAYQGYRASGSPPAQPLYAERLLFHLLRAAATAGASADCCLPLCYHLYQDLASCRGGSAGFTQDYEAVAKNSFSVLWKRAESEEEASEEGGGRPYRQALTLRLSSLRFLALLEGGPLRPSPLLGKFSLACSLYEKGGGWPSKGQAGHLARAFEEGLLPSLDSIGPSPFLICQLTTHCCSVLCRAGHPTLALDILSRAQELLPSSAPPHFGACLGLCQLAARMRLPGLGWSETLDQAEQLLHSVGEAPGWDEMWALALGCRQLTMAAGLEARRGQKEPFSAQELLGLAAFLRLYLPLLTQEVDGAQEQTALWKQCFQNLEGFTSSVYDYLMESQEKDPSEAQCLADSCHDMVKTMVQLEAALTQEGLSEYAGATALRVHNLAYGFYSHRLFTQAIEVACALGMEGPLPGWFRHIHLPQDRVPKFYRLLVDCCRKAGRLQLALDLVTVWLGSPACWGPGSLSKPVALWVSLKAEAVKDGDEELQLRTLMDALEPWGLDSCFLAGLLSEELQAYKRLRVDTAQERFNVICDLLQLADQEPCARLEQERAVHLVELAQVLCYRDFRQHTQCSATDCVEEALVILESLLETSTSRQQLQDDQARASLWLYICNLEDRIRDSVEGCRRKRAAAVGTAGLEEGETNDVDYEERQQGAAFPQDSIAFNLRAENRHCRPLDQALHLWKRVLSEYLAPALRSLEQTVHDLHLMAALYRLMDKPFQAMESYGLSLCLLDPHSEPLSVTNVLLHVAEILLQLEDAQLAGTCLDEAELLLKSSDPAKSDYPLVMSTYSILRSQQLYATQQVAEGLALLLEILQSPLLQTPSKVWYLLKAKAQQLTASYLSLPASVLPAQLRGKLQEQGWSSAEAALTDSHKMLCGIVMLLCPGVLTFGNTHPELTSPPNSGDNLYQKWLVLCALLTCSRRLVRLLTGIGNTQEAKMFCLEALRLTTKLQCVRPCAQMLVASAELELQRGEHAACGLELERVLELLESKTEFGAGTSTDGKDRKRRICPSKGQVAEVEGEGNERGEEGEAASSFLRVCHFSPAPCPYPWGQSASPELQPRSLTLPQALAHPPTCSCAHCTDPTISSTCLRWALVQAGLGQHKESQALLQAVLERARPRAARLHDSLVQALQASCFVGRGMGAPGLGYRRMEALGGQVVVQGSKSHKVEALGHVDQVMGPAGGEDPATASAVLGPCEAARSYSQLAWLSLGCEWSVKVQKRPLGDLECSWPGKRRPSELELTQAWASLLLVQALGLLGPLSQRQGCSPVGLFSPSWGWAQAQRQGRDPLPSQAKAGPGLKPRREQPSRFRVLEDRTDVVCDRPRAGARTRLRKKFDDSEVEWDGDPTAAPAAEASPSTTSTSSSSSAKTQGGAPRKRQSKACRPQQRAGRGRHEAKRGTQAKTGSSRQPVKEVPESEVLRRCESAPQKGLNTLTLDRRGNQTPSGAQHPPSTLGFSADVTALDSVYSCLTEAVASISHCPPSGLYARACRLLALCVGSRDPHTTAFLLSESLAITARHQMMQNLHRKALKNRKAQGADVATQLQKLSLSNNRNPGPNPHSLYLSELRSAFQFWGAEPSAWAQDGAAAFREQLRHIPADVVVCLLTLAAVGPHDTGDVLLFTRLEKGRVPISVQIPTESGTVSVSSLLTEFDAILKEQKEISNVTELKAWWEGRTALDRRMKHLVDSLETGVLGCWRCLLLPSCPNTQVQQEAEAFGRFLEERGYQYEHQDLLKTMLSASHLLTPLDIQSLSGGLRGSCPSEVGDYLQGAVDRLKLLTGRHTRQSSQLILMLDKDLQRLPWESMPLLRGGRVSRLPSFQFLLGYTITKKHQLKSVMTKGVDPGNVFYVLNPQGNLPNTEKTFKAWFERKEGWDGVVGRGPSQEQLKSVLCNRDLYLYAGHGAGVQFLEGQEIQKLSCRAVSLLLGCSSATLALRGNLEGVGIVLKYMMAGCPLYLGNLWDVTDKDIDRYMEQLLKGWLGAQDHTSLLHHISRARQAPKLKYLIGASPVVYGLDVSLQ
ncbi:separin [Hemitrygon akajei]|uniref:separin n=1 Tax=Hemitrygon akajei TaxID=2704970 RepID=UPI003BF9B665